MATHRRTRSKTQGGQRKVIGYVRVSTGEQALGPEAQRSAMLAWCAAHDCEMVNLFYDQAVGGAASTDHQKHHNEERERHRGWELDFARRAAIVNFLYYGRRSLWMTLKRRCCGLWSGWGTRKETSAASQKAHRSGGPAWSENLCPACLSEKIQERQRDPKEEGQRERAQADRGFFLCSARVRTPPARAADVPCPARDQCGAKDLLCDRASATDRIVTAGS
jgi:hypothetical protein